MAGDDLTVCLFFLSCAVVFGLETFKAETVARRISFGVLTAVCAASGIFWSQLKTVWPGLTDKVTAVATNPVSWFGVALFLLAVFAFHRPRQKENTPLAVKSYTAAPPIKAPEPRRTVEPSKSPEPISEPVQASASTAIPESAKKRGREFIDTTPEYLIGLRNQENMSRVQTDKVIAPYIGKWIAATGTIHEIFEHALILDIGEDKFGKRVSVGIDARSKDKFHLLELKKKITVVGQISRVLYSEVELEHGELIG